MNRNRHRNRLRDATSPYLLQHADNPVDWYPWGPEALRRARETNRPIFLSIGYAACHWCHVMERESFENPEIAAQMNADFVCIKVDREERPDLDDIYMRSVQMMSGQGGWPLTVFLTPELEPFAGGTYFPPEDRPHMPGLPRVLSHIAASWRDRRDEAVEIATLLRARLQERPGGAAAPSPDGELIHRAAMSVHDRFDPNYGGFTPAPKFPNTTWLALLLRHGATQHDDEIIGAAGFTLESMAAGGIRDHVGGGFHRYATDARWLVPHFEKMLYDNALLTCAYLDAYQITGDPTHARVARSTLDWVERDMQLPEGGFASSMDADSEGIEGKYYVWSDAEIRALLGGSADVFCATYGIRPGGNWEGSNIVHLPQPLSHVAGRHGTSEDELRERLHRQLLTLREARAERVPPGLDDKVLSDWNGMMIAAMARAYRVLDESRYLESATRAAEFVWTRMRDGDRLLHSHRGGHSHLLGYLDDYAAMLWACIELFESCFELRWLTRACHLGDQLLELFAHPEGGFFFTGTDHEALIARTRAGHDGATPSGNALAATWLRRLATLSGEPRYAQAAGATIDAFAGPLRRTPIAHAQLLLALDAQLAEPREIVLVGSHDHPEGAMALRSLWSRYAPTITIVALDPDSAGAAALTAAVPLLRGKSEAATPGRLTFFDCRNHTCKAPTDRLDEVLAPRRTPAS